MSQKEGLGSSREEASGVGHGVRTPSPRFLRSESESLTKTWKGNTSEKADSSSGGLRVNSTWDLMT